MTSWFSGNSDETSCSVTETRRTVLPNEHHTTSHFVRSDSVQQRVRDFGTHSEIDTSVIK